jgi:hypothetical protein
MKRTISFAMVALIAGLAACGRGGNRSDTALNSDLSLAAQQKGFRPMDSLGPAERAAGGAAVSGAPLANAPQRRTRSAAGDVAPTTRRSTSGSRSTSSAPAQASRETVVKHTKRDAAIGAAAGAVIGATTSRNKVKGGIIGGIVGGILGGVVGNNVDKTKKKKP